MKTRIQVLLILLTFAACTKINEDFSGQNIDNSLIGKWNKQYNITDPDNGITLLFDTIIFNSDNSGIWVRYRFSELDNSDPFYFYTEDENLYIKFVKNDVQNIWTYKIKNDTLTIENSQFKR